MRSFALACVACVALSCGSAVASATTPAKAALHVLSHGHDVHDAFADDAASVASSRGFGLLAATLAAPLPAVAPASILAEMAHVMSSSKSSNSKSGNSKNWLSSRAVAPAALVFVVEGVDVSEPLFDVTVPKTEITLAKSHFVHDAASSLFHDQGVSANVVGSIANLYAANKDSLVVSLSSSAGLAQVLGARDSAGGDIVKMDVFSMENTLEAEGLVSNDVSDAVVRDLKEEPLDDEATSLFNVNDDEASADFIAEITAARLLLSSIQDDDSLAALLADKTPDFFAVGFAAVQLLRAQYGIHSSQYHNALRVVRHAIEDVKSKFLAVYPRGVVVVLTTPPLMSDDSMMHQLNRRDIPFSQSVNYSTVNWTTVDQCNAATHNCSNRGNCTLLPGTASAYACQCSKSSYLLPDCYREEVSAQFFILLFVTVALILSTVFVIAGLANVDSTNDTLLYGTGGTRTKSE